MYILNKSLRAVCITITLLSAAAWAQASDFVDVGRAATPAEIQSWDIDVRPDFKGLPPGSGTVDQGNDIWDASCAACHGSFAESNEVFTAIVGGTTVDDITTGHVAALKGRTQPVRTTFMKVDTVATLWDYIYRAMPWDAPKSLSPDEVYGVLAYLLNLAEIVPEDFTLSDKTIAQVQDRMPNRNGMVFWEGLWKADGQPDTHNTACMADCEPEPVVSSSLPDYARDSNGNLAAQMRIVGPVRGADTLQPKLTGAVSENTDAVKALARSTIESGAGGPAGAGATAGGAPDGHNTAAITLLQANACMACHAVDKKLLGPSFRAVAEKYKDDDGALHRLVDKVRDGGSGAWGNIAMPPHPHLDQADSELMLEWILAGPPATK